MVLFVLFNSGCFSDNPGKAESGHEATQTIPRSVADFAAIQGLFPSGDCNLKLDLNGRVSQLKGTLMGGESGTERFAVIALDNTQTLFLFRSGISGGGILEVGDADDFVMGFDSLRTFDPVWRRDGENGWIVRAEVVGSGSRNGAQAAVKVELTCTGFGE